MKIYLSRYSMNDSDELYKAIILSTSHLKPWMPWLHDDYCIDDTRSWVELCINDWNNSSAYRYLIRNFHTHALLGSVGLERINHAHKVAELGYWVVSNAVNQGVATAACELLISDAFRIHHMHRLEINILTNNEASNRVANKLNTVYEGALRNKLFHLGRSHPANCYSIIPADYNQ